MEPINLLPAGSSLSECNISSFGGIFWTVLVNSTTVLVAIIAGFLIATFVFKNKKLQILFAVCGILLTPVLAVKISIAIGAATDVNYIDLFRYLTTPFSKGSLWMDPFRGAWCL